MTKTSGLLQRVPATLRSTVALVLTDEGKPTPRMKSLLRLHRLPYGSFREAVESTQKSWRKAAKAGDLATNADRRFSKYVLSNTLRLLDALGQNDNSLTTPSLAYYDWAAVHEHYPLEAFRRLEALTKAWKHGVRFGRVAVLGCAIPLPPDKNISHLVARGFLPLNNPSHPVAQPVTSLGAIGWLLRNGPFPLEMRQLPIDLISSPFRRGPHDVNYEYSVWPDTGDSIDSWWQCGQQQEHVGAHNCPDYPGAPDRWYWPVEGRLGNILAASNGWQDSRQRILTWTELVKQDARFCISTIETISGKPGYSYSASLRLREFAGFLWTVQNRLLKPYLGWRG